MGQEGVGGGVHPFCGLGVMIVQSQIISSILKRCRMNRSKLTMAIYVGLASYLGLHSPVQRLVIDSDGIGRFVEYPLYISSGAS